jgi:hypothetical protein
MRVTAIVEGHGEVEALPILIRRIGLELDPPVAVEVPRPIRQPRSGLLKPQELERVVRLAASKSDRILILIDADEDCPAKLGPELLQRANLARPDRNIRAVVARSEFEAWFLAAAESVAGKRGISADVRAPARPEDIRDAKGWITSRMEGSRTYRETIDQPALAAFFDLQAARSAPSFDKFWRDLASLLQTGPP